MLVRIPACPPRRHYSRGSRSDVLVLQDPQAKQRDGVAGRRSRYDIGRRHQTPAAEGFFRRSQVDRFRRTALVTYLETARP